MAYFTYSQNNSGGSFDYDPQRGISEYVIVEANAATEADVLAESIGLYFDGDGDCECCGDRWSNAWGNGDAFPMIYGQILAEYKRDYIWIRGGFGVFVHYADGRTVGYLKDDSAKELDA